MRRSIILLYVLGFTFLIVGSLLAIRPLRKSIIPPKIIHSSGRIASSDNEDPQEATSATNLDIIGYLAVLASIGFFAIAFLRNRKPT